ncbi:MAG: hypothetical protein CSA38_00700 [Flavobacteriales bacterium]|nr:MAG: hypothetical protein CSA38_00700 [Flavobacteriales bacterium]
MRKFEQINKGEKYNDTNIGPKSIGITLNKNLEIVYINPEDENLFQKLMDNQLTIAKDCPCLKIQ